MAVTVRCGCLGDSRAGVCPDGAEIDGFSLVTVQCFPVQVEPMRRGTTRHRVSMSPPKRNVRHRATASDSSRLWPPTNSSRSPWDPRVPSRRDSLPSGDGNQVPLHLNRGGLSPPYDSDVRGALSLDDNPQGRPVGGIPRHSGSAALLVFVMMKTTAEPRWKAPTRTAGAPQIALQFRRCLTKLEMLPPVSFYNISKLIDWTLLSGRQLMGASL